MKTLDRQKPFGTIHGIGRAKYDQGGVLFDGLGNEIVEGNEVTPAQDFGHEVGLQPPVSDQVSAQLAEVAPASNPEPMPEAAREIGIDVDGDGKVDLKVKDGKVTKVKGKKK